MKLWTIEEIIEHNCPILFYDNLSDRLHLNKPVSEPPLWTNYLEIKLPEVATFN